MSVRSSAHCDCYTSDQCMAPSGDFCPICNAAFYGRQKFLRCSGCCGLRYHLVCLKFGEPEYEIFMKTGCSTYLCQACTNAMKSRQGDSTPVRSIHGGVGDGASKPVQEDTSPVKAGTGAVKKKIISPTRELNLPELQSTNSLSVQIETVRLNSVSILETLNSVLEHVKNLENEVAYLKSENAALKLQVSEIITSNSNCSKSGGYRERPSAKLYSTAVQPAQKKISADPARPAVVELPVASRAVDHVPAVSTVSSPAVTEIVDSLPDGFQVVTHKRRKREPRVGTRNATGIEMAPERAKTKSLFVSRFGPNVSISNIKDSLTQQSTLANQININFLKVTKLKTKFQTYSSFHILVEERDFEAINNPNVWPEGCLIAPFYGKLKPEQHFDFATPVVSNDTQGTSS